MSRRYSQLNLADRRRLFHFVERKLPVKEMARQLGRHRSTIYREIRRNTFTIASCPTIAATSQRLLTTSAKSGRSV
ncbi:IS30 family transposase [Sinorhizobium terangae]|nr:IS30 family transposase [Sinorhizobium terangae]